MPAPDNTTRVQVDEAHLGLALRAYDLYGEVHKVTTLPDGSIHIEHDPYTLGGVRYGRHTILRTFSKLPWWRRLLGWLRP